MDALRIYFQVGHLGDDFDDLCVAWHRNFCDGRRELASLDDLYHVWDNCCVPLYTYRKPDSEFSSCSYDLGERGFLKLAPILARSLITCADHGQAAYLCKYVMDNTRNDVATGMGRSASVPPRGEELQTVEVNPETDLYSNVYLEISRLRRIANAHVSPSHKTYFLEIFDGQKEVESYNRPQYVTSIGSEVRRFSEGMFFRRLRLEALGDVVRHIWRIYLRKPYAEFMNDLDEWLGERDTALQPLLSQYISDYQAAESSVDFITETTYQMIDSYYKARILIEFCDENAERQRSNLRIATDLSTLISGRRSRELGVLTVKDTLMLKETLAVLLINALRHAQAASILIGGAQKARTLGFTNQANRLDDLYRSLPFDD